MYGPYKDKPVSEQIKYLRNEVCMSQEEFATYLGLSVRAVQSWEQGQRKPTTGFIELIQRVLIAENMIDCPSPFESNKERDALIEQRREELFIQRKHEREKRKARIKKKLKERENISSIK